MKDKVKVTIFGREYLVVTDADEDYVLEIANYLERKVKEVSENGTPTSISPPVLMASLGIIDDFFSLQREFDEFKRNTERKTKDLAELLESPEERGKVPENPFSPEGTSI